MDEATRNYVIKYQIVENIFKSKYQIKMSFEHLEDFYYYFNENFEFKFDDIMIKK